MPLTRIVCLAGALSMIVDASDKLTPAEARHLVEITPEFLRSKGRKGCPRAELLWTGKDTAVFQVRNWCPTSGSGLIGEYLVDLNTYDVWIGIDRDIRVGSDRLRTAQEALKKRRSTKSKKEGKTAESKR